MRQFYCLISVFFSCFNILLAAGPDGPQRPKHTNDLDDHDWVYMVPGLGYQVMKFANTVGPDLFHGVQIEYVFVGGRDGDNYNDWNRDYSPDRDIELADLRFYGKIGLLSANDKSVSRMFTGGLGINLSFEGRTTREFLIPYYGMEINVFNQVEKNGGIVYTPVLGMSLISTSQLRVNYTAGLNLMPSHYKEYRSLSQSLTVNYSLW